MKRLILILSASTFLLGGCGFKQDPLSGQSDRLRNSGPKKPDKPPEKPIETRNLLIDRSAAVTFVEGQEAYITVSARCLLPEFDQTQVIVENMDEFPDARFIEAEGKFIWKPRTGTTGEITEIRKVLKVRAFATSSKEKNLGALTHAEEVAVTVTKIPDIPTIQQVVDLPPRLREGDDEIFHVLVKDKDGGVTEPILQFGNPAVAGTPSLSSYIEVLKSSYDPSTQLWTFDCRISIRGEMTNSVQSAGFTVKVLTGFGKSSPVLNISLLILTTLDNWTSTWQTGVKIKPGVEVRMPFVLYNTKGEGMISIVKRGLPGTDSKLDCDAMPAARSLKCTLTYKPVGTKASRLEFIDLDLKIQNPDSRDTLVLLPSMSFGFQVEAL